MNGNVTISIIMPIYNCQDYLHQSIDSVLGQTFGEIELICVDDCSTDNSVAIIEEYEKQDNRVKLLRHKKNLGPMKARSDGVMVAVGQYIIFLDSDDEFVRHACERLNDIAKQRQADIYGFGTEVVCHDLSAERQPQDYFKMYGGELHGQDILLKSFVNREFTRNIWDKMYNAQLCKKAYEMIWEDSQNQVWFSISEDSFGFLYIAYHAESFYGINEALYRYHYGRGAMGSGILSLNRFEKYCTSAIDAEKIHEFFTKRGVLEQYKQVADTFRAEMLYICTYAWSYQIASENKPEAMEVLMRYWRAADIALWVTSIWNDNCGLIEWSDTLAATSKAKSWEVPFAMLPKGGRVVLYGAGDMGQDYHRQITDSGICEVILWVDKNYSAIRDSGLPVRAPKEITDVSFDCILIAIRDYKTVCAVKQYLVSINVYESMIVWSDPATHGLT